jgi:hypothetical protein
MENPFRPPILTPDKTDPTEDKKLVTKFLGEDMARLLDDNRTHTSEPQGITEEERKQALEEVEKLKAEVKESTFPLEQKDHWNRKDLIQWTLEQVGIDDKDEAEKWVDEYFTVNHDGIIVRGTPIDLANNKTITILPPQVTFNGYAGFEGCISLTAIPQGTVFTGVAYFDSCISLTTIPEGTVFNGYAGFRGCTSLTVIPEGIVFKGNADLRGCTSLIVIPLGTVFNGDVYFAGCTSLTTETITMLKEKKDNGEIKGSLYLPNETTEYTGK